jgi:hypothetical protein
MINLESPWHLVSASLIFATDTLIASTMCYILYNSRTEYDRCAVGLTCCISILTLRASVQDEFHH